MEQGPAKTRRSSQEDDLSLIYKFGATLQKARENLPGKPTVSVLAKELGVSYGTLKNYELGIAFPPEIILSNLIRVYQVQDSEVENFSKIFKASEEAFKKGKKSKIKLSNKANKPDKINATPEGFYPPGVNTW